MSSALEDLAKIVSLIEKYEEHLEDLAKEIKKQFKKFHGKVKSSDIGNKRIAKMKKLLTSHTRHVQKGRYKIAGKRLEKIIKLRDKIKKELGKD